MYRAASLNTQALHVHRQQLDLRVVQASAPGRHLAVDPKSRTTASTASMRALSSAAPGTSATVQIVSVRLAAPCEAMPVPDSV